MEAGKRWPGLVVGSPLSGRALPLTEVPDPVFSTGMVGPGTAIDPRPAATQQQAATPVEDAVPVVGAMPVEDAAPVEVVAPIDGTLVKLHPHAFVVSSPSGVAVLVHLGIDTVRLQGQGFSLLASEGDLLTAGQPVVRWDLARAVRAGLSPLCPVIVLDTAEERITGRLPRDTGVSIGSPLFTVVRSAAGDPACATGAPR